ncbi:hypothetical protein Pst134EA_006933 [Puccinia striiformis f. sp. tritici]|uniref:NUDE domain-containing protein n=1 Tax=Puccinia striiformis TaxID=27350 RepID=A0A2S4V7P9_9BASI|nr:hypothetical protein Pst134EA_006933 [Puccinia striiformis f. sp. tritici]KAH9469645.1 hypothetical protein Pst134EA_006933 [Puccinia striiformis f. sp. tritici]POW05524.1 hypothetical protein PSTT_09631 [Puccinia striiformis]
MEDPSFTSDGDALDYFRSLARSLQLDLDDTKSALDEFQLSSKELETELEAELQATEKQLKELRGKEEHLLHEIDQWKIKYHTSLKDHTKTMTHMQTELETCRKSNEEYRTRLRDMELDNDELEGKERMVTSSLQDVENKYGKAIERITLLEDELIEKSKLEEEHQRLKDDLRDTLEELSVLREHMANSTISSVSADLTRQAISPSPPDCQPIRTFSQTPLSDPGLEVLKDTDEMASPSRSMIRTKAISMLPDARDSPRRRLSSAAADSPKLQNAKPITITQLKKGGSLRGKPNSTPATTKPLHIIFSPDPRLAATTTAAPKPKRAQSRSRPSIGAPTNTVNRGSSHLQSLRAETERMQGMTKKLVSSRNLRTVSAIPVPKTTVLSASVYSKSNPHINPSLNRSTAASTTNHITTRSPRRLPNAITFTASRNVTQPPTSQDKDHQDTGQSVSSIPILNHHHLSSKKNQKITNLHRSIFLKNRSSSLPSIFTTTTQTGLPRPRSTRPLSRLSISSDTQSQPIVTTGIPTMITSSDLHHPHLPTALGCGIPRRKASIDLNEKFHSSLASSLTSSSSNSTSTRPLSIQELYRSHLRRQSNILNPTSTTTTTTTTSKSKIDPSSTRNPDLSSTSTTTNTTTNTTNTQKSNPLGKSFGHSFRNAQLPFKRSNQNT